METDGAGGSGSGGGGGGAGSCGGGGSAGSVEPEKKTTPEGEPRVKRKMKTPYQLELLEKTYAMETYPSEELRAELSVKLGLSDRQLQMWFCHRRLKDRKAPAEKQQTKRASPAAVAGPSGRSSGEMAVNNTEVENEHGSGLSLFGNSDLMPRPPQQQRVVHKVGTSVPRITTEMPAMRRFYEPPLAISEQRAIAFVEAQLGEPLREDGPILGMEFDPLPPGAFGAPIVTPVQQKHAGRSHEAQLYERPDPKIIKGASQAIHEFQFLPENPSLRSESYERTLPSHYYGSPADVQSARFPSSSGRSFKHGNEQEPSGHNLQGQTPVLSLLPHPGRQGNHLSPASGGVDIAPRINPLVNDNINANYVVRPATGPDNQIITPDRHVVLEERLEKKCKSEEARVAREIEAHEKRIRKELEKQDILRRKREEQMRKDMERQDRERRKEEERLLREKQREEERYQREQRREIERREKFLQKEYIRAEKKRLKEEMRREKEAARLRAANDRAAARRIAKESTELIEDEQLELMEFAASNRGSSSVLALDNETLQNVELLKDKLPDFPPKSVLLKRPFGVQPWADSEESVGNLLMVWRFLITFADVLGLWPFTLDEFAQAFHDYDPRLLGEIHIAILRCIIKDIEDVARTPANAVGSNQNSVNPGGGHPQIIEGAYAWGFDICSWQRHLTPLTWPEVLRQFALAAGFGPKLKKRSLQPAYHHDEIESNDGTDVISNLRNGVAAEKAVAIMQERGLSNPRRSRHRLTPGTVKFAAFHVLSLEGSKGLTILEVADKIQKSGLRDLTTSKTPEASISAALSRDIKLFERTAPSTYCLRSPYRKDPADTEVILSSAREKIQLFQNKYVDGIGADDVEKEDADRDQESESDILDDPDVDDLDTELKLKGNLHSKDTDQFEVENFCGYGKDNSCRELIEDSPKNLKQNSPSMQSLGFRDIKSRGTSSDQIVDVIGIHSQTTNPGQDTLIDECSYGEPWVQGLALGEYASLSVEERLDALVALIGVVNEGNAIRSTLEERLEAATALKKQMLAEAQLDRRRTKEDYVIKMQHSSFTSNRAEQNVSLGAFEDRRISLLGVDGKTESADADSVFRMGLNGQQSDQNYGKDLVGEKNLPVLEYSVGLDNPSLQQSLYAAEKSQFELKAFIGHRAEEMYVYRSLPLGQDRRRNRYWQFIASPSQNDPGSGRIYVELQDGRWRLIDTEEGFDDLLALLDVRGVRESHLRSMLQRIETSFKEAARKNFANSGQHVGDEVKKEVLEMGSKPYICSSMESPKNVISIPGFNLQELSSSAIELGRNGTDDKFAMERYRYSEKWMWEECFNSNIVCALKYGTPRSQQLLEICDCSHAKCFCEDNHCPCHRISDTSGNKLGFSEHVTQCERKLREESDGVLHKLDLSVPPRIRLLKAQLATVEVRM
ncbi:homeobox-DDT domain RLT2-like [Olea europaea subsp. europaea]|uniref:Homeobox-DDT domain RLT2-like n=1 Tax=Olea europaea subsp. europaea TaxID=158383 RepID=A0A8S0Q0M0_OLEEU|nr:homeobox-DDT domain RLT2-like [Olea europaea subsp. europaea]